MKLTLEFSFRILLVHYAKRSGTRKITRDYHHVPPTTFAEMFRGLRPPQVETEEFDAGGLDRTVHSESNYFTLEEAQSALPEYIEKAIRINGKKLTVEIEIAPKTPQTTPFSEKEAARAERLKIKNDTWTIPISTRRTRHLVKEYEPDEHETRVRTLCGGVLFIGQDIANDLTRCNTIPPKNACANCVKLWKKKTRK